MLKATRRHRIRMRRSLMLRLQEATPRAPKT